MSRDPIVDLAVVTPEYGSTITAQQNLYSFVNNAPLGETDILGLVKAAFDVIVGKFQVFSGTWGQPFYSASGKAIIGSSAAETHVMVWSVPGKGGSCNSVSTESYFSRSITESKSSGTIYASVVGEPNDCCGEYDVTVDITVGLGGNGPEPDLKAKATYSIVGHSSIAADAHTGQPYSGGMLAIATVSLCPGDKVEVAKYLPTLSFKNAAVLKNWGLAAGKISIINIQPK